MKKNIFMVIVAFAAMMLVGCGSDKIEVQPESQIEKSVIVVENEDDDSIEYEDTENEIIEENGMITRIIDGEKVTATKEYWAELGFNTKTNNW